jgi:hypothetical protein
MRIISIAGTRWPEAYANPPGLHCHDRASLQLALKPTKRIQAGACLSLSRDPHQPDYAGVATTCEHCEGSEILVRG